MIEAFGLGMSVKLFFHLMISFSFFVGIILMVSSEAFESVSHVFLKEYGVKTKVFPPLENTVTDAIDKVVIKNRVLGGMLISIFSFFLLVFFK